MSLNRNFAVLVALTLTSSASGQPVVSAVLNGASFTALVSPGCWVSIFGSKLAASSTSAQDVPLPLTLGNVSVSVGGLAAPLLYVSPNQINALIPGGVSIPANTVVPLVVTSPDGSSAYNIRLTRNAPAIFTQNGAGTGRAFAFDANFKDLPTISTNDIAVFYAAGLGPTDGSGKAIDPVEVYVGERQARVLSATLAPGFPGIYQVNVTAPAPATDRLYLRVWGWQSNIADIGIRSGLNVTNVSGDIDGLYPSTDPFFTMPPCLEDPSPTSCGPGQTLSIMLHAASFRVSLDLVPSAVPFDVAAVGPGGASLVSIDPVAATFIASVTTLSSDAARGDFSKSIVPLWDYANCNPVTAICSAFPGPGILPVSRLDPLWLQATRALPAPNANAITGPTVPIQLSGVLSRGRLVIDSNTNTVLSRFGAIVQVPFGPFDKMVSTFKLYVDGRLVTSKDVPYRVVNRQVVPTK